MTQAISYEQIILEKVKKLTLQQQQEVLDFIKFLHIKNQNIEIPTPEKKPISAYEAAKQWVGCVDSGIGDLSYNKKYLERPSAK
ncbi:MULTISPECIES: DUF2281 domain-containing protein [Okeania]|uniref:DUF2281 domain-containing protein n=1 Tax=Okeania TaxID=1458928 RepID=UPI000F53448A|nr:MULTISPECIES: DUF2281 domain-containing protein [Okeania]NES91584.1 DUF2281 domain-containing protein [Okeania sp. SIO2B9]NET76135.1 DUF2281 domain-containing protein [Okeania sp. SIO1F9]RQH11090.1 DUF2281 domain-containing protein [Okeania hirsuta]